MSSWTTSSLSNRRGRVERPGQRASLRWGTGSGLRSIKPPLSMTSPTNQLTLSKRLSWSARFRRTSNLNSARTCARFSTRSITLQTVRGACPDFGLLQADDHSTPRSSPRGALSRTSPFSSPASLEVAGESPGPYEPAHRPCDQSAPLALIQAFGNNDPVP